MKNKISVFFGEDGRGQDGVWNGFLLETIDKQRALKKSLTEEALKHFGVKEEEQVERCSLEVGGGEHSLLIDGVKVLSFLASEIPWQVVYRKHYEPSETDEKK